jgi:phage terminase large subunit-like protein
MTKRRPPDPNHATHAYARDVLDGKVFAGKWVKLACARHIRDLEQGHKRGLWFDEDAANRVFRFFGILKFSKGEWAGQPFVLQPWQKFLLGCAFGWKRADGTRRFRETHLEVGRKNGKTEVAGGVGLYLTTADGEHGGEVYIAATKRDQARLTFDVAKNMAAGSPLLASRVKRYHSSIAHPASGSKMVPLGADADTLDGLNPSAAIKDELHKWRDRNLWDVLDTATGARAQPFGLSTTTAGSNRQSIWWERRERVLKVLQGTFDDDELFGLVYTLDDEDDWTDERTYGKANPNLGVTVQLDELCKRRDEAKQTPGMIGAFKRLRLDMPTDSAESWLDSAVWAACCDPVDEKDLEGRECWGGLDLSQTTDLTAWALLFPPSIADPKWRLLVRQFLPKDVIRKRVEKDRVPYDVWAEAGLFTLTPGDCVDYGTLKKQVLEDAGRFIVRGLAFDRMFALPVIQDLQGEGLDCVPWGQGFLSLNTPTKEFGRMLAAKEIGHQGNAVLTWEAGNVAVEQDAAGNLKPSKKKSNERIDGIAASMNALGLALAKHSTGAVSAGILELELEDLFGGY